MLVQGQRPRELRWYHAGAMLFGDWGTSRLYVLGLCLAFNRQSSFWYMLAMSVLLLAVGWAYQVICRLYPDGGGVYSSARQRAPILGMIGGLLLCADYVVTAAISALDALHYINLPYPHLWAAGCIGLIGVLNFFGPRKSGTAALAVGLITVVLTLIIAVAAFPSLRHARIEAPAGGPVQWWTQFTLIILAISGVEAIGNMTGIMVQPVPKTAKKAILPVMLEIVILNLVMTLAMQAVPLEVLGDGDPSQAFTAHRDDMMKVLAMHYVGPAFATVASIAFALLLLSAVNTAVTDLVSIQYMMSKDKELPKLFSGLNRFGMPVLALIISTAVPLLLLLALPDVGSLADLYAIGVIGAVAVNLGTTSTNFKHQMSRLERYGMMSLAVVMIGIWCTIAYEKPDALLFALSIMSVGLGARWLVQHRSQWKKWMLTPVSTFIAPPQLPITQAPVAVTKPLQPQHPSPYQPLRQLLVATRSNNQLVRFALDEARQRQAMLLVLFVRQVSVVPMGPATVVDTDQDPEAQKLFDEVTKIAEREGIPVQMRYIETDDVAGAILEVVTKEPVEYLILGATQRGGLWRTMKGDVMQKVAQHLPAKTSLLIHA